MSGEELQSAYEHIRQLEVKVSKLQTALRMATMSEDEIVRKAVSADQSFEDAETGIALTDDEKRSEVIILKVKKMKLTRHESGTWQVAPDRTAAMVLAKHIAEILEGRLPVAETTLGMAISPLVNQLLDAAAASWPGPKELPGVDVRTLPKLNEDPTA